MHLRWFALAALVAPALAYGGCENLIALSKITTSTAASKSSVEQHASNFCNEFSTKRADQRSASFSASYKVLSAGMGSSSATLEEVASKYCAAQAGGSRSDDAFQQYVESIAPNAYQAYEACLRYDDKFLKMDVDPATILPESFVVGIRYQGLLQKAPPAKLFRVTSAGITCKWNTAVADRYQLNAGGSVSLNCTRLDRGVPGYISVLWTGFAGAPLNLAWPAYSQEGAPINVVEKLRQNHEVEISKVRDQLTSSQARVTRLEARQATFTCDESTSGWVFTPPNTFVWTAEIAIPPGHFLHPADQTCEVGETVVPIKTKVLLQPNKVLCEGTRASSAGGGHVRVKTRFCRPILESE